MIKQAREGAKILYLPRHRVRQVAEHARLITYNQDLDIGEFEKMILEGEMQMLGVPVKVVGRYATD